MPEATERRQNVHRTSLYADVLVELTQMTFRNLLPTVLVSGGALVGTAFLLAWHYQTDRWLWLLALLMLGAATARIACVLAYRGQRMTPLTLRAADHWQNAYAAVTLAYCFAMAASTLYNFRFHDSTAWTLCTIGTFLICAGLTSRVGLHPRVLHACGLLLLVALATGILLSAEPLVRVGLLLVVYFAITYFQSVQSKFDLMVEQMRSRRTLRLLADHDPLTGLSNRRHFEQVLTTTLNSETPFAVLFVSLDRFKAVNENFGHKVGDILLQRVGVRLKGSVRHGDLVARMGGDDFTILQMAGASQQAAESLARRITRAVAASFEIDGNSVQISASVGIRISSPEDREVHAVLNKGDGALYYVRQNGNGVHENATSPPAA